MSDPVGDPVSGQVNGQVHAEGHRRHRRRRRSRRRLVLRIALVVGVVILALGTLGAALAMGRYLPAYDSAREMREDVERIVGRLRGAGLDLDRKTVDLLAGDLATARTRYEDLADLLRSDPLVGIARNLPPTAADVKGADAIVAAAGELLGAAGDGMSVAYRFVEIKEAQEADPAGHSALSQLVELMATSRDRLARIQEAIGRSRHVLASVPTNLARPLEDARSSMVTRLDEYAPIVDALAEASGPVPAILGWDAPRRYLVLTQNPAELRPTGGYTGSYGIVAFDKGRITEATFRDIYVLDLPWDYPFIEPPQALEDVLLGPTQPWQLADANWSPHFPTSAQDAIRLYVNESDDARIDGVLAITTYTIDRLLAVTGPVSLPEFDLTIGSGETTLKLMQAIWAATGEGSLERKAVLGPFAQRLFAALQELPPSSWATLAADGETFRRERLLLAWFKDPASQAMIERTGFDGAVRQDAGDFVYPVDSNVAPTSKLNAVTSRELDLEVRINEYGNADNRLTVTWDNRIETDEGAPYRALPLAGDLRVLGMYFRLVVPERSRLEDVSGGGSVELSDPYEVEETFGRTVFANYLKIPAGQTSLTYAWTSPYAADADDTGGTYRLTVQKQPGLLPGPLTITISAPEGHRITGAGEGLTISGDGTGTTFETTFDRDVVLELRYEPEAAP